MGVRGLVLGACGRVWWCLLGALAVTPATQCGAAPGTCFYRQHGEGPRYPHPRDSLHGVGGACEL
jgi:hypothetical protein